MDKANRPKAVKIPIKDPEPYDGSSPDKLRNFIFQCNLVFRGRKASFPTEDSKVFYAISYLSGTALEYFEPYVASGQEHDFLNNWDSFVKVMTATFGAINPEAAAEAALANVKFPENGKATIFFVNFAKYAERTNFNDSALRYMAYKALPKRIKDRLAVVFPPPETFKELKDLVSSMDARYWEYEKEKSITNPSTSKQPSSGGNTNNQKSSSTASTQASSSNTKSASSKKGSSSTSGASPEYAKVLGKDGRLLPEERQRRVDNNLCLLCGKKGHIATNCPKKSSSSKGQVKGRSAKAAKSNKPEDKESPPDPAGSKN